jgi:tetratricopeptide (TPR) repeat protein
MGFTDSANIVFEEIIARDPNNKDVLFNLSMTQVQNAQAFSDEIARHSKKANELAQQYNQRAADGAPEKELKAIERQQRDAVSSLKETQSNAKEAWGKAEVLLKRFAGLDSTDYEVLYFLGLSEFWLEKYDEAAHSLDRAVTLKSDYCDAWQALYFTYLRAGQSDLANQAKAALDECAQ